MNATTPEKPLKKAIKFSEKADLSLVLGSSMQVTPFCELPTYAQTMVICNLQNTPYNKHAKLVLHERCNKILRKITEYFSMEIPFFHYKIPFLVKISKNAENWRFLLSGSRVNEPCMCVGEVEIFHKNSKKKIILEQARDLSFSGILENAKSGEEVTWKFMFKEDFGVEPMEEKMELVEEGSEKIFHFCKIVHFA